MVLYSNIHLDIFIWWWIGLRGRLVYVCACVVEWGVSYNLECSLKLIISDITWEGTHALQIPILYSFNYNSDKVKLNLLVDNNGRFKCARVLRRCLWNLSAEEADNLIRSWELKDFRMVVASKCSCHACWEGMFLLGKNFEMESHIVYSVMAPGLEWVTWISSTFVKLDLTFYSRLMSYD